MLLNVRFLGVAKLSVIITLLCQVSFPIVGLKLSALPILTMKSSKKKNSHVILGIYQIHVPFPHRSCPPNHQLYLLLGHERSEQWYHTSGPLSISMKSYH
jgi:hypothetical protein